MNELPFSKERLLRKNTISVREFKSIVSDESSLQRQCEEYLDLHRITYIRVPDAIYKAIFGTTDIKPHIKRLISSFIKGLPDLTILIKGVKYNQALCVELKTSKGKLSQGQKSFAKNVNVHIVRSFEDFEKLVNAFSNGV